MTKKQDSTTHLAIDQQFVHLSTIIEAVQTGMEQVRSAAIPAIVFQGIGQLSTSVKQIRNQVDLLEDERRRLTALAEVGQLVNSSLEVDGVLEVVMDTIVSITGAERGFLMLKDENDQMKIRIACNWSQANIGDTELSISKTVVNRVLSSGESVLTTNAQEDNRFATQDSVIAYNLRSILCVPLEVKDVLTGVIYADNRVKSGIFTTKELELLVAFANQAAVALENARLFESVKKTLAEVTELKNLMGNVFASIASGVMTADIDERIMLCNRAAENILGRTSLELVGCTLREGLQPLVSILEPHVKEVLQTDRQVVGLEARPALPPRGQVDLRLSLSPLKDMKEVTQGVAIVMEDLTEKKKLEGSRRLFERMVSPAVIEQLNPDGLKLGGNRAEITVLFADLRGFTEFSEQVEPEELVTVLNRYLALATDAVLEQGGTVDKFLGDAVMAWFNAPLPQPDHVERALRAALNIRSALRAMHRSEPLHSQLAFGMGIHVGEAILGLIGTEKRLDYTAIGDCVNTTKRIQESAGPEQILISSQVYQQVQHLVSVKPAQVIQAKGKRDPIQVYRVINFLVGS
ncbi:MAG: GAF domain-containing protein [Anaerolineae bacterium]|nr:GAF domain-containing protein [Anaerolineae bacterium]